LVPEWTRGVAGAGAEDAEGAVFGDSGFVGGGRSGGGWSAVAAGAGTGGGGDVSVESRESAGGGFGGRFGDRVGDQPGTDGAIDCDARGIVNDDGGRAAEFCGAGADAATAISGAGGYPGGRAIYLWRRRG